MAFIPGIDVSAWEPNIDWEAVKQSGVRFAFMKATEGVHYADKTFAQNWLNTKRIGIIRGAYHYLRGDVDAEKQADLYLKTVTFESGDFPPVLDLENIGNENISNSVMVSRAETWLNKVSQVTNKTPIIYSGPYFLKDRITRPVLGPPLWAKKYTLWLAHYLLNYHEGSMPMQPASWQDWKFWQYTDRGHVPGIEGGVDLNWFRGSLDDLYAFVEAKAPEPGFHTVKENESLQSIAKMYGVAVLDLLDINPQLLVKGMALKIPPFASSSAKTNVPPDTPNIAVTEPQAPVAGYVQYAVKKGDTLAGIASQFRLSVEKITAENRIANPDQIVVGQILRIPKG